MPVTTEAGVADFGDRVDREGGVDDREGGEGGGGFLAVDAASVLGGEAQVVGDAGFEPGEFGADRGADRGVVGFGAGDRVLDARRLAAPAKPVARN